MIEAIGRWLGRSERKLAQLLSADPLPKGSPFEQRLITTGALLIFAAGLAFRLLYAYRIRETFGLLGNRYGKAMGIAENLLRNGFYSIDGLNPNVSEEPVFPILIAASQLLPGAPWSSYLLLQLAIAAAGAWAAYRICVLYGAHRPHALLASAIFFAHPYLASQSVTVTDTQLFASVLALTACSWLVLQERNTVRAAVGAGILLGLSFLTRSTTLVLLPTLAVCLLATMWAEGWRGWQKRTRNTALASIVTLAVVTPWCLRNWQLTDHFMIATHDSGIVWFYGNNPDTYETLKNNVSVDSMVLDPEGELSKIADSRYEPGTPRHELALQDLFKRKGVDWAIDHPGEFIALVPLRLVRMWSWNLNPKYDDEGREVPSYALKSSVMRWFYLPITLLAGLAFCVPALWNRGTLFCAASLIFFSGAASMLYGFTRLRAPFDIFLIIPAVQSALWLLARSREGRKDGSKPTE
jgi:4-amino-4-deoxy-L-arabinose transferase-like glycosyltransferase